MMISKEEAVRHYLYPIGSEKRIAEDGMLALRSGYTIMIQPPERDPGR